MTAKKVDTAAFFDPPYPPPEGGPREFPGCCYVRVPVGQSAEVPLGYTVDLPAGYGLLLVGSPARTDLVVHPRLVAGRARVQVTVSNALQDYGAVREGEPLALGMVVRSVDF